MVPSIKAADEKEKSCWNVCSPKDWTGADLLRENGLVEICVCAIYRLPIVSLLDSKVFSSDDIGRRDIAVVL